MARNCTGLARVCVPAKQPRRRHPERRQRQGQAAERHRQRGRVGDGEQQASRDTYGAPQHRRHENRGEASGGQRNGANEAHDKADPFRTRHETTSAEPADDGVRARRPGSAARGKNRLAAGAARLRPRDSEAYHASGYRAALKAATTRAVYPAGPKAVESPDRGAPSSVSRRGDVSMSDDQHQSASDARRARDG